VSAVHDDLATYYREPWMTDDQWECALLLCTLMRGFHHCPKIKPCGHGIEARHYGGLSTFDFDALTRAVFLAHDHCIRVEVAPSGPGLVKLRLHRRHKREGYINERHPTLEEAVATWREKWPLPTGDGERNG
jgi:hypothetical protein